MGRLRGTDGWLADWMLMLGHRTKCRLAFQILGNIADMCLLGTDAWGSTASTLEDVVLRVEPNTTGASARFGCYRR